MLFFISIPAGVARFTRTLSLDPSFDGSNVTVYMNRSLLRGLELHRVVVIRKKSRPRERLKRVTVKTACSALLSESSLRSRAR